MEALDDFDEFGVPEQQGAVIPLLGGLRVGTAASVSRLMGAVKNLTAITFADGSCTARMASRKSATTFSHLKGDPRRREWYRL